MSIVGRYLSKKVEKEEWNSKITSVTKRYLNKKVKQE
jgi:hypothetical protein